MNPKTEASKASTAVTPYFEALQAKASACRNTHKELVSELKRDQRAYSEGVGSEYEKSLKLISDLTQRLEEADLRIAALHASFAELMKASGGEVTKAVNDVQREKTEAQEIRETQADMLAEEKRRVRKLWPDAVDAARSLELKAQQQQKSWHDMTVTDILAEAIPQLSPHLAKALTMDSAAVVAELSAWAKALQDAGTLPTYDQTFSTVLPDLMALRGNDYPGGMAMHNIRRMVELEGKQDAAQELASVRYSLEHHRDSSQFTIPGGICPDAEDAWHQF